MVKTQYKQSLIPIFYNNLVDETLLPLLIMMTTPHVILLLPYLIVNKNSDFRLCFSKQTLELYSMKSRIESIGMKQIVFKPGLKILIKRIEKKFVSNIFHTTK